MTSSPIILKSSDNMQFTIEKEAALGSKLVADILKDYDGLPIPVQNVDGKILEQIIRYLNYYSNQSPKDYPKPLPTTNLADILDPWDLEFINSFDRNDVFKLIDASNYMDIPSLLDLGSMKIASEMIQKSPEEIRNLFNLADDLTDEEKKEAEAYQI